MSKKAKTEQTKKRARHGEGTLVLRGKKYYARWVVGGKVYTRTTGTSDKEEALDKLAEFVHPFALRDEAKRLREIQDKLGGVENEIKAFDEAEKKKEEEKPALSVAEAFAAYRSCLSRPNRAGGNTLDRYESQFGEFSQWLTTNHPEVKELRHVTQEIAEEFLTGLAKRATAGTYNKRIVLFRSIWKHLEKAARLTENPWLAISKQVVVNHTRRELTVEELGKIVTSLTGEMRLLFAFGIYTGLRLGDCALLEWGSVDLVRNLIVLAPHKTMKHHNGKTVFIPLHQTLAGLLETIPADKRNGYVLPSTAETYKRDASAVSKQIQKVFEANGVKTQSDEKSAGGKAQIDVGFHSLRHTFVSLSANAGVPLAHVQSIVGHANPAMTRHYFHESLSALRGAVAALPALGESAEKKAVALPKSLLRTLDKLSHEQIVALQAEIAKRL